MLIRKAQSNPIKIKDFVAIASNGNDVILSQDSVLREEQKSEHAIDANGKILVRSTEHPPAEREIAHGGMAISSPGHDDVEGRKTIAHESTKKSKREDKR